MPHRALPPLAVAFGLGIWASSVWGTWAAGASVPLLVCAWWLRSRWLVWPAMAFLVGCLRLTMALAGDAPKLSRDRTTLIGRVDAIPRPEQNGVTFFLDAKAPIHGRVRLRVLGPQNAVPLPGDVVSADVLLHEPRGYRNPGALDREQTLRGRGVVAVATLAPPRTLHIIDAKWSWLRGIVAWRQRLAKCLDAQLRGERRALVGAMALGERAIVPDDIEQAFRRAGLSHLLSVSGLHLAVVALLAYALLARLLARAWPLPLVTHTRAIAAALTIPLVVVYAAISGADVPVVRSAIVATAILGATCVSRPADGPSALGAAAILILLGDPVALFDVSFQLSFAACVGLLVAPRSASRGSVGALLNLASITLSAWLMTAPLVARYFGELPVAGALANLICVPLTTLALVPFAVAGTFLLPVVPALSGALVWVAGTVSQVLVAVARMFADAPGGVVALGMPTILESLFAWAVAVLLLRRRFKGAFIAMAMLAASVCGSELCRRVSSDVRVTFLDVGQGDSILVELPKGHAMLVDGGGLFDGGPEVGEAAVLPYLRYRRVRRLDVVALSHPHPDHFGGLAAVAEHIPIGEFWSSGEPSEFPAMLALKQELHSMGVPTRNAHRLRIGDAQVVPIHPDPTWEPALSTNDNSLVLRVGIGPHAVLLAGDLEARGEWIVAASQPRADVLKVPHHGSRTSSTEELLNAVGPRLAVASLGMDNRFGFPHAAVQDRYRQHDIPFLQTAIEGAVIVRLRTSGVRVETVRSGIVAEWQ